MADKAKRPRKACPKCFAVFSDRHARRHLLECNVKFCESEIDKSNVEYIPNKSNTDENDVVIDNQNDISDDEFEMNYDGMKKYTSSRAQSCNNLEDEDIETYFDKSENNENDSDFSDTFSDVEFDCLDSVVVDQESDIDSNITKITYWFCKLLLLWQCIYYVSDAAICVLLNIFASFLKLLSFNSNIYSEVHSIFPKNMYQLSKLLKSNMLEFKQYVVCTSCYSLYELEDCYNVIEGTKVSKKCSFIEFPNHRLPHLRKRCNQVLLMEIKSESSKILVPYKIFCYKSIKSSLSYFVKRNNFEDLCEQWRFRERKEGIMYDIYDGKLWDEFNGTKYEFFTNEGYYGCILNVDWFQPYKHTHCSIGVMYLAFLNLPRDERFKRENVLLVGVIPDMKCEPKTNTFITPLVEELKQSWSEGFLLFSYKSPETLKCFKLALICVGCDIPASRKLCGFLGHAATAGCNKCTKKFPGDVGEKNYGGFDRATWIPRNADNHRQECNLIKNATSKGDKESLERQFGTRYSVLLQLDYFDPIRMTALDPMHNLFLGTAKHMLSVWKSKKLLCDEDFKRIEVKLEPFECPSDVGRLPKKFSSSYGSFNADQYKNWTLLFSVYALTDLLPKEHLECWRKFVLACRRLCSMFISIDNAKVADRLLLEFLNKFEQLYGEDYVTPNMHLHGHLYDCIIDFGPVYSFWLFSFERENGILGSYKTNKKNIEVQLMRRFLKESFVREKDIQMDKNLLSIFNEMSGSIRDRGTLNDISVHLKPSIVELSSQYVPITQVSWDITDNVFVPKTKNIILNDSEFRLLGQMYSTLYQHDFIVCSSVKECKMLYLNGTLLGCKFSRSARSSYILAYWCNNEGSIDTNNDEFSPHPGQIVKIYMHNVIVNGVAKTHFVAKVSWFRRLPDSVRYYFGKPIELWSSDLHVQEGSGMFIPVHRIKCRFVYMKTNFRNKSVIVVSPRERHIV